MDFNNWERLKSVFDEAADLDEEDQLAAARQLLGDDSEAIATLNLLFEEDRKSNTLLDGDLSLREHVTPAHPPIHVQDEIGPYRILRLLGEGGMSVVYLAERVTVGGNVAIKFLRTSWHSPAREARFTREQKLLAGLNHPSIARLYETNFLSDGTPWFAMEYVDGVPINQFRAKSLTEVMGLLRQTCEAVRYAHSFATIHRDLKPSNILVTADGQVKLLDFGIAKQIDSEGFNEITYDAVSPMTPAYAAPEQKGYGNIGVFTDIYALGILFYELVVGRLPEPVSSEGSVRLLPALRKSETIVEIHPSQYSDLDLLCATCTQYDSQMRYGSVEALLRDIDAFREGRPLHAKRADLRELFTKYLRRNKAALSAVAGASVLLITTVMFFTIRLEQSRARAQAETQRLERMRQFTEGLFQGGNPSAGPQIDMTLTDLLRHGEITADSMSQEPLLQIDMLSTLGTVYQRIGNLERADHLLTRVVPQTQTFYGERSPEYVDSLVSLGLLRKDQGKVQDARKLLEKALLLAGESSDKSSKTRERATWALASVAALEGDYRSSKDLMSQAIDMAQRTQRTQTEQFVLDLQGLADDEFYLGEYQAAQQLYEQTISLDFKVNGERHPSVAQLYNGLGNIALNRNDLPTSISYFQKSLAIDEGWYGASHPDVADDLSTLSRPLILMKNYDEAREDLTRSLAILLQVYGENHSRVATAYTSLGILAFQRNELHEAESNFNKALAIWTRVYGQRHPFVALCYANLASAEMASKNYPQAIDFFHKALSIYEANSPQESFNAAVAHMKLGRALLRSKEYDAAIPESLAGFRYFVQNNDTQSQYRIGAKLDLDQELAHTDGSSTSNSIREELRRTP